MALSEDGLRNLCKSSFLHSSHSLRTSQITPA